MYEIIYQERVRYGFLGLVQFLLEGKVITYSGLFSDCLHGEHVSFELFLLLVLFLEEGSEVVTGLLQEEVEVVAVYVVGLGVLKNVGQFGLLAFFLFLLLLLLGLELVFFCVLGSLEFTAFS